MKRRIVWPALCLLAILSCLPALVGGPEEEVPPPTDAGEVDPAPGNPYGLDARPSNPTCLAPARPVTSAGVTTQDAFANLSFELPVLVLQAPGDARVFVVERGNSGQGVPGKIRVFPHSPSVQMSEVQDFLSLPVNATSEGGLLGVAFHPNWQSNREVFVSYTETGANGGSSLRSVVSRFKSADNGLTLDPASEEIILKLDQPQANHNGGGIAFGPDGYLYIGFGDGGGGGDPLGAAQKDHTLLGKFIRIDVNVPAAQKYAIPPTNPFAASGQPCNKNSSAHNGGAASGTPCAEIHAKGFRNPWRWSFDSETGELWVGDVGQDVWEEVDRVVLGGNYGWDTREGAHCYPPGANCSAAGLIEPIVEYDHAQGLSITGGYVYRGAAIPSLVGKFIYGDYSSGRIWAVSSDPNTGAYQPQLLVDTSHSISSFGQLHDGEVYWTHLFGGKIYKLVPSGNVDAGSPFPQKLSQTGCFDPADPKRPVPALIPYDVNAPLWSDGARKERHFALPDGARLHVNADGDWDFPNGSVLTKTFFVAGKRVETRLFMRHPDGSWAGYSYEWDDAEQDATLLPAGKTKHVGGQSWSYPSRAQCLACHTAIAGRTLGLETGQLNRTLRYPSTGRTRNQLLTLEHIGLFDEPLGAAPEGLTRFADPEGTDALELRARAYLHANCSGCHRAGAGRGPADFRHARTLDEMGVCNVAPQHGTLGRSDAKLLAPGSPAQSLLSVRMHALDAYRMPPLGSAVVDPVGTQVIGGWITSLTGCP